MVDPHIVEHPVLDFASSFRVKEELLHLLRFLWVLFSITVMCLSIGTPKNNKFSICQMEN